jgi:hypothetical protein
MSADMVTSEAGPPTPVAPSGISVVVKFCPLTQRASLEVDVTFDAPANLPAPSPGEPYSAFFVR